MIIKSNSIILATDSSPAFVEAKSGLPYKTKLYPLSFVNNLTFDIPNTRARMKQLSSQDFAYDSLQFAPVINLSFDYTSSVEFLNEAFFGIIFGANEFNQSVLKSTNDFSTNLYFILSDDHPFDLIYKIKQVGNLNNLNCWSFGNCRVKSYSMRMAAGSLPSTSISFEALNTQMQTISNNLINCPAINTSVGNQNNIANVKVDNSDFLRALDTLNTSISGQPILPTFDSKFTLSNTNIQSPSIVISPHSDSAITAINLSVEFERENSYGFESNYIYDSKIKYPLLGTVDIEAVAFGLYSGTNSLTGIMTTESGYDLAINSSGTINSKTITLKNSKLQSHSYSIDYASNLTAKFSFSFQANENNGLVCQWTQNINPSSGQLFTKDLLRIISSDGKEIRTSDNYYFSS